MGSQHDLPVRPGDVLLGKYRVERVLGAGGMGAVLEATHMALEQRVAMKFMLPHVAEREGNLERFMREARAASKLRSEHVPKVLDFGTLEENMPYLVMELLEGQDLAALIRPDVPLDVGEICEIGIQACEAFSEAHGRGIIHRDIKPANLFVTRRADGSPCVKVLDFGIAKQTVEAGALDQQDLTTTDTMIGSPFYMSPEQLRSARNVDARSDIWSLGVSLYQAITCKRPYVADNLGSLILAIVETVPQHPSAVRPDVPPQLGDAILRCLQRNPSDRYQTMGEFAEALAPFAPPRCHALLDRIRANCDPNGERSGERSAHSGPYAMQGRISATPTPAPRSGSYGLGIDSASGQAPLGKTNGAWTGTHSGKLPSSTGRFMAVVGAALLGAVATAVLFGTIFRSQPPATVPAASAPALTGTTPSSSVAASPQLASAEVSAAPPLVTAAPSASAIEPAPKAAPAIRRRASSPAPKSDETLPLPDYGGRK